MVRRCAVPTCDSTDKSAISHRFPRKVDSAHKWQQSLQLQHIDLAELINKYVICTLHFKNSDYRNAASKHLNFTAIPTLHVSQSQTDTTEEPITLPSSRTLRSANSITNETEQLMNLELFRSDETGQDTESKEGPDEEFDKSMSTYFCEDTEQHMMDHQSNHFVVESLNVSPTFSNDFIEIEEGEDEQDSNVTYCSYEPIDSEDDCAYVEDEELLENANKEVMPTEDVEVADTTEITQEQEETSIEPLLYRHMSRHTLIEHLIEANNKIAQLESKLKSFESAHSTLLNNFESFKSILNP